jgi:hypothetical protein
LWGGLKDSQIKIQGEIKMIKGFSQIKETMDKAALLFKMKSGENKLIRILISTTDVSAAWEHVENFGGFWKTIECLGKKECPICKAGKNASLKTYIPILDRTDNRVKIFKASRDVVKNLIAQEEEYGDLTQRDYKVVRTGEGLRTQYQFFAKDKTDEDLSEFIALIPPTENLIEQLTKEEIEALMDGMLAQGNAENSTTEGEYPF